MFLCALGETKNLCDRFIVIFTLLWWSGTELATSLRSAMFCYFQFL